MAVEYMNDSYNRCIAELRNRYRGRAISNNAKNEAAALDKREEEFCADTEAYILFDSRSKIADSYRSGEYDVVGVDLSMMSADPFAVLAQFARPYSGGAYDFSESADDFDLVPGFTGYASAEYDKLMTQALNEKDAAKRAELLKKAEKMLLEKAGSITEIAFACGFNNSNYFIHDFKKHHGITPLQYALNSQKE